MKIIAAGRVIAATLLLTTGLATGARAQNLTYAVPQETLGECKDDGTRKVADPINVIWVGSNLRAHDLADFLENTGVRWPAGNYPFAGNKQWIIDEGECKREDVQSVRGIKSKHHTREFGLTHEQHGRGVVVLDAHRDQKSFRCPFKVAGLKTPAPNDVVPIKISYKRGMLSGYDRAQREFLDAYGDLDYYAGSQLTPHKRSYSQCNPRNGGRIDIPWNGVVQIFDFDPH
jgi:hypothetical protein